MDFEKDMLLNIFKVHENLLKNQSNKPVLQIAKVPKKSEEARKEGNILYLQSKHDNLTHLQIFAHYNRSVALAPLNSEQLALAYGNRSAFLLHIQKYDECIQDIEKALKITESNNLKIKLLCREVESMNALGLHSYGSVWKRCQSCIEGIDDTDKNKKQLLSLIEKTAKQVFNNKPDVNRSNVKKKKKVKIELFSRKTRDHFNSVTIDYNEKYGRNLIAARDFMPGEIVFVEDLFAAVLSSKNHFTNCAHCFEYCWAGLACDHCNWALFCSERCKKESWQQYHDIECAIVPSIQIFTRDVKQSFHLSLRILIIGMREAGSIDNLKAELELVDKNTESGSGEFYKIGKVMSKTIKNIYSLKFKENMEDLGKLGDYIAFNVLSIVLCLIKYSSLFGGKSTCTEVRDLINNEDTLFIASLLLRLTMIQMINSYNLNYDDRNNDQSKDPLQSIKINSSTAYKCIASLACLMNHSCFPNVRRSFTQDRKIIVYSVQPIRKNSQIFDTYKHVFYNAPKTERQQFLLHYNFTCDCPPCSNDWPPLRFISKGLYGAVLQDQNQLKIYHDFEKVFMSLHQRKTTYTEDVLNRLSVSIKKCLEQFKQPNELTCSLIEALTVIFKMKYDVKDPSFGTCTQYAPPKRKVTTPRQMNIL